MLAPLILFVYNRPTHTNIVLDKLKLIKEVKDTVLYVFCDGPKQFHTENDLNNIEQVKKIISDVNFFKEKIVFYNEINQGLANSVINGVSEVLRIHDKVIVLEDDIVPEKGFLKYMNEALYTYQDVQEIGCIHGWNYTFKKNVIKTTTFLLKGADCWGWATWKRSWDLFEKDGYKLKQEIENKDLVFSFNRNGTHPFYEMLTDQIHGKNDSWAIRWHASLFLANKFCLQPKYPIVKNIGFDGSGTHCGNEEIYQITTKFINLNKSTLFVEDDQFYKSFEFGLLNKPSSFTFYYFKNLFYSIINLIKIKL
jgi:hypothetical protein